MSVTLPPEMLAAMLDGSYQSRILVDAYYDGVPTVPDLQPMPAGQISVTADGNVQTTGRVYFRTDEHDSRGRRLMPRAMRDPLAPFGQELDVRLQVSIGARVVGEQSLARLRIREVPTLAQTSKRTVRYGIGQGVAFELALADRFEAIDADKFTEPTVVRFPDSTWAEMRQICRFPIETSLPDKPIPATLVYEESRLEAMQLLAKNLGGVLHQKRNGAITVRPEEADLARPSIDLTGAIQEIGNSLSNNLSNVVVVRGKTVNDVQVIGVARVEAGPLSPAGPLGARVLEVSDQLLETQEQVDARARAELNRASQTQTKELRVTCLPHPGVEPGDAVKVTDPENGRTEVGLVSRIDYNLDPTALMQLTVTIPRESIPWV